MTNFRMRLVVLPAALISKLREYTTGDLYWLAVICVVIVGIGSCLGGGYYLGKWAAIGAAMTMIVGPAIYDRYGLACSAMVSYLVWSALWVITLAQSRYAHLNPYDLLGIRYFAADSLAKLLLMVAPFMFLKLDRHCMRAIGRLLCVAFVLISLTQIGWEWLRSGCDAVNSCGGALRNPSLNDSMMAVCLPIVASVIPFGWAIVVPIALAAMAGKSAIGTGMCAVYVVLLLAGKGWKGMVSIIVAAPAILCAGYYTHGGKAFFDSSGRFPMWQFFMKLWSVNKHNIAWGTGFGTFGVFSTNLQQAFKMNQSDWWIWMHNDWLQMAFECGLFGLALMVWLYLDCIYRLYRNKDFPELQSLILFGVGMGCEYFLHIGPICLFAAWIMAVALMKREVPSSVFGDQHGVDDSVMRYVFP